MLVSLEEFMMLFAFSNDITLFVIQFLLCPIAIEIFFSTCNLLIRNIHLPVLPPGLRIMADQGFEHRLPVLVMPHANQPQLPRNMCRFTQLHFFFSQNRNKCNILS